MTSPNNPPSQSNPEASQTELSDTLDLIADMFDEPLLRTSHPSTQYALAQEQLQADPLGDNYKAVVVEFSADMSHNDDRLNGMVAVVTFVHRNDAGEEVALGDTTAVTSKQPGAMHDIILKKFFSDDHTQGWALYTQESSILGERPDAVVPDAFLYEDHLATVKRQLATGIPEQGRTDGPTVSVEELQLIERAINLIERTDPILINRIR